MIKTVGELKAWFIETGVFDDTPVWIGETVVEGGVDYYDRVKKYEVEALLVNETFGTLLPKDKQRIETGVVLY